MLYALCITIFLNLFSGQASLNTIFARVTAYAPHDNISGICNDGDPTNTATGTYPRKGTIAADPARLPYGTILFIPGYGPGIVEDTGGALRGKDEIRIDVYMDTHSEALKWGVQWIEIQIINPADRGIERW